MIQKKLHSIISKGVVCRDVESQMSQPQWERRYRMCDKQRRYAWAKYYELAGTAHQRDYTRWETITHMTVSEELSPFVKQQLIEMGAELKKVWECPICIEMIQPEQLDITPCGHYYCKKCLETLKQQTNVVCPVCRHRLKGGTSSDEN